MFTPEDVRRNFPVSPRSVALLMRILRYHMKDSDLVLNCVTLLHNVSMSRECPAPPMLTDIVLFRHQCLASPLALLAQVYFKLCSTPALTYVRAFIAHCPFMQRTGMLCAPPLPQ